MAAAVMETERLRLRHLREDDLDALHAVLGDPDAMRHYPHPFSREETLAWIRRNVERYARDGHGLWGIELKDTAELVGDCGLVWQTVDGERELEVGYHVRRDVWGRGIATEAARACVAYAFSRLGARRVIALVRPVNLQSRRVAEKAGLAVERETIYADLPHLVYAKTSGG